MKTLLLGCLIFTSLYAWTASAEIPEVKTVYFEAGDAAFAKRADTPMAVQALTHYREAYQKLGNTEAAWRLAMATYFNGFRVDKEPNSQVRLFKEGFDVAEAALKLSPRSVECHFWAAINLALLGQMQGVFHSLKYLPKIRSHLEKVIEIDASYMHAGADRLLGAIDQKLPGILGGSYVSAKAHFERAVVLGSDEPLNYLFLSRLMKEDLGDQAAAKRIALNGSKLLQPSEERVESREAWNELQSFE